LGDRDTFTPGPRPLPLPHTPPDAVQRGGLLDDLTARDTVAEHGGNDALKIWAIYEGSRCPDGGGIGPFLNSYTSY